MWNMFLANAPNPCVRYRSNDKIISYIVKWISISLSWIFNLISWLIFFNFDHFLLSLSCWCVVGTCQIMLFGRSLSLFWCIFWVGIRMSLKSFWIMTKIIPLDMFTCPSIYTTIFFAEKSCLVQMYLPTSASFCCILLIPESLCFISTIIHWNWIHSPKYFLHFLNCKMSLIWEAFPVPLNTWWWPVLYICFMWFLCIVLKLCKKTWTMSLHSRLHRKFDADKNFLGIYCMICFTLLSLYEIQCEEWLIFI